MPVMAIKWEELVNLSQQAEGNILLYGPPGTGKTFLSHWLGRLMRRAVYSVTMSEDLSAQELIGHFVPKGGEFVWHNGPALLAWNCGGILNLNEINRCSGGAEIALHSILDDLEIARLTLPSGKTVSPSPGFFCVATMNGEPDELPGPLLDRFAVRVEVSIPHDDAFNKIKSEELREGCRNHYKRTATPPHTFRQFLSVDRLIRNGVPENVAFMAVFGKAAEEVHSAFIAARASKKEKEQPPLPGVKK